MFSIFKKKYQRINALDSKQDYNFYLNDYSIPQNKLNHLCKKYGCDKGVFDNFSDYFSWFPHNYTDIYDSIFFDKRNNIKNVFELGIGTNKIFNKRLKRITQPGASLRIWRDYFKYADIYGGDIDPKTLFQEKRIKTFLVDQTNIKSIQNMWRKIKIKKFDIIIDDGLHNFNAAITFFENSIDKLSRFGFYFIEDIFHKEIDIYLNYFSNRKYRINFFSIKNKVVQVDNNILMIRHA